MPSSFEVLQRRERLRVGQRFLELRPRIAGLGALCNAIVLSASSAPTAQKQALGCALGVTIAAFFVEAWWLGRRELTERWLFGSLALTLLMLGTGALMSGDLTSPFMPLLFAPVVVGFAAFGRQRESFTLLGVAVSLSVVLGLGGPLGAFPELPTTTVRGVLAVSTITSFVLLAVGVISLVDAHASVAGQLERLRVDLLLEAERRAASVEQLGAQVAHEVKNPLAAARGLVQLVERHIDDERDKQRLAVVVSEVDRALAVLQDYLSFSRPLSDLSLGPVELSALLADVAGVLEARAHEKAVQLRLSAETVEVWADRQRLRDAVLNLALNAVTALPRGGTLELAASADARHARVTVSDDGPGMRPELLARLGEPYTTESEGGTGLGILLAQSVARQHGGSLRFESATGEGVRAILELPLRQTGPG